MREYRPAGDFYSPSREQFQEIVQYDAFYTAYLDMLALLQDLICEFTDSLEKPSFTPAQIEDQKSRVLNSLYTRQIIRNPENLVNNINANYTRAQKIRSENERSETQEERFQAAQSATRFLNALVETYTTLRILKQNREPAH